MPWEDTEDFIRSGHRDPKEFEPDSLRTITLSEEEGIKAVIGKPKSKKTTEVVSYLFSKEKEWTLEKAKQWFSEHQAKAKESFSWAGSIKELPGASNLIRGKALHPLRTVHPEEWPEVREYLEEELQKSAHSLKDKPLILDHYQPLHGKVLGAEYEEGAIEYVAQLNDPGVMELIKNGAIKHCSVEFEWKFLKQVNGVAPLGINFTGLSLLRLFEPGDPLTTVEVWEGIVKKLKEAKVREQAEPQQFIFYVIRDATDFIPEMFSTTWVDEVNGIQAITGRLREHPDTETFQALLFMKANGWTIEKMQDWLQSHPQYLRGPAPAQPGIQPSSGVTGVMKMSNQIREEPKTDKQRFMTHFGLTEEQVDTLLEILGEVIYKLLPERGTKITKEQGNDENGEQKKLRQAQKERAEKYSISPKERGHLTKPDEYKDVPEDKFADPVNYRYPVTEKYVKGALTYFNQPENREAGGYSHDETVKIMTKIINAALNASIEVSWQPEDPVYRDLSEELKKKLTGYEKPSQTVTEQQGEELSVEEIKQKIADLTAQKETLYQQLQELAEEERAEIQTQIDVLFSEIQAYEQALATKIATQTAPPEETLVAESKKKSLGEAIIEPETPSEPTELISKQKVLALVPDKRVWRSWSYGPQMLVKQLNRLLEGEKVNG